MKAIVLVLTASLLTTACNIEITEDDDQENEQQNNSQSESEDKNRYSVGGTYVNEPEGEEFEGFPKPEPSDM